MVAARTLSRLVILAGAVAWTTAPAGALAQTVTPGDLLTTPLAGTPMIKPIPIGSLAVSQPPAPDL
jgi:hypothetical protein